jgi:hypothetical protein
LEWCQTRLILHLSRYCHSLSFFSFPSIFNQSWSFHFCDLSHEPAMHLSTCQFLCYHANDSIIIIIYRTDLLCHTSLNFNT